MRLFSPVIVAVVITVMAAVRADAGPDRSKKETRPEDASRKAAELVQRHTYQQGFRMKVWLSNQATMGIYAEWPGGVPANSYGMEYPENSGIEHLYGAGPWIGAIVDTSSPGRPPRLLRKVTTGYEGWSGPLQEMFGNPDGRDSFYVASIDDDGPPNKAGFDDDNDGLIDEDELDGYDNDGDWNPAADDLGSDGLPDSMEIGCKGGYDPVTNQDPSFDNWDSSRVDQCAEVRGGQPIPRQSSRFAYTQGNGLPNHGEPHVDEDYAAISESDAYVAYSDIYGNPTRIANHYPLGIKVWQRTYTWRRRIKAPIFPIVLKFIHVGQKPLDSVFVGFFADCDVGPVSVSTYAGDNNAGYLKDVRTAYVQNTLDKPATPAGLVVLGAPDSLSKLKYTFQWYPGTETPTPDEQRYRFMTSGTIKPDEYPNTSDTRFFFSFGPIRKNEQTVIQPGDTLLVAMALVSGAGLTAGPDNLRDNAAYAVELYGRGFSTRPVPPSPPLKVAKGNDRVTLNWKWQEGDRGCNPEQTWDDSDRFLGGLPDTHWRKRDPVERCPVSLNPSPTGGRVFEGYRVWRSESPVYNERSFALLKQYDVDDDLNQEYQTGLQYSLVDSNLVRGRVYWYAVTSFTLPGLSIVQIPQTDSTLPVLYDTLVSPPVESDFTENLSLVILPFEPSSKLGDVRVVPNPYRTDVDYTYEAGGWEGLGRTWTESKRVIWFIHLPPICTIRIFGLAGDLITTLPHDDGTRVTPDRPVGQEEWNLLTESGRALASGVYIFTVESDFGRQIGKFVVIR